MSKTWIYSCYTGVILAVVGFAGHVQADVPALDIPSGVYQLDPNHTTLAFKVEHLGLSTYVARFTGVTSTIELDAANILNSAVALSIDPLSIKADYAGDYRRIYPDTSFDGWDEHLAKDAKFFDATVHPAITFTSTSITQTGENTGIVTGELNLLGQTQAMEMNVTLNGVLSDHPFIPGRAVLGVSGSGVIKRSDFGLTFLLEPPFVGDDVLVEFEAEYLKSVATE